MVCYCSWVRPTRLVGRLFALPVLASTIGVLCFGGSANAANEVILRYSGDEQTVEVGNLETFARTGEAERPEVQAFFERRPEAKRLVQELFDAEIYISPSFVSRFRERAESPTGDFVLIQLNKLISTPSNPDNLDLLRTAIRNSLEDDNRLSLVELIREYPEPEIRVDLTGLEPVYNDVKGFVEKVLPALEVARDYLQNIICDCETQSTQSGNSTSETSSETSTTKTSTTETVGAAVPVTAPANCIKQTSTEATAPSEQEQQATQPQTTAPQITRPQATVSQTETTLIDQR